MARCPRCATDDLTRIDLEVHVQDQVTFYSCRNCEEKWWVRDGDVIVLDELLEASARTRG